MLKFIREKLSVGDYVEVETPSTILRGTILSISPESILIDADNKQETLSENQLLGLKYFSEDNDPYQNCYIQKFFLFEKHTDSFFGKNHDHTLECSYLNNKISLSLGENISIIHGHLDFPDIIDVEDGYFNVENLDEGNGYNTNLTSVKLPNKLKEVFSGFFDESEYLQKIYVPNTLVGPGSYKIGGCTTCQVFDLNGNPIDWDIKPDDYW